LRITLRITLLIGVVALVAAATAAASTDGSVTISTGKVRGLGTVLVDSKGRTLYMFVPDKQKRVTCVKSCAAAWPPVKLAKGQKIVAAKGVKKSLLGSDANPSGGRVVTYARWPLYTWVGDQKPGQATGQALDVNGGLWYVLTPAGKVLKTKLSG
jgi:predicted lipoprotein with Yx(FWY)xxD motif